LVEESVALSFLALLRVVEVSDVVTERGRAGVGKEPVLAVEIGDVVVGVDIIDAEFEAMVAVDPVHGVGDLEAIFAGQGGAVEELGRAELEEAAQADVGRRGRGILR